MPILKLLYVYELMCENFKTIENESVVQKCHYIAKLLHSFSFCEYPILNTYIRLLYCEKTTVNCYMSMSREIQKRCFNEKRLLASRNFSDLP